MKFCEASNLYSLNKSTYVNLRWIAYSGQLMTILVVQFLFNFKFNYLPCVGILILSILTNLYLQFRIRGNQISNFIRSLKKLENKDGYISRNFYPIQEKIKYKFKSGPFTDQIFKPWNRLCEYRVKGPIFYIFWDK